MERPFIAEAKNLHISFRASPIRSWTLRDEFIRLLKKPHLAMRPTRDRLDILRDINFRIYKGDRIGILGVNGVGKTTLCRCLAGLYSPTQGSAQVHGRVRCVFDTALGIYPELSGRENARLLMHFLYPELGASHASMMQEALEFSELGAFLDRPFKFYSNGMQARLCLSLISCRPADLLILDEVFDGADRFFKEKISRRIVSIIETSGAVVFVSHSLDQIVRVCNRAIVLERGQVVFDGPVEPAIALYTSGRKSQENRQGNPELGL